MIPDTSTMRRDHIRAAIAEILGGGGRKISEIRAGKAPGGGQEALRGEPVWHTRGEFLDPVAERLHLHPSLWGRGRKSIDFYNAVDQELAKLRRSGAISDWKKNSGVFRLSKDLPPGWADISKRALVPVELSTDMGTVFMDILRRGCKANTYKFALARAMLDHCIENSRADPESAAAREIPYRYLASKFLRYYWHQECKFRIKQDFKSKSDPKVIYAIRDVFGSTTPGHFGMLKKADVERAESKILKTVFGQENKKTSLVVPRFQKISRGPRTDMFYKHNDDEQKMWLKPEAFSFFRDNHRILVGAVLAEWAKFLERINSLPMLMAKLERYAAKKKSLAAYKTMYLKHTCHCFYCAGRLEKGRTHVDHLIPWSYMFEDDPWNLVLSCRDCNCRKSDSLPQREFLDHLIHRNKQYSYTISKLRQSLDMLNAGRGWEREIRGHYVACKEYGFAVQRLP